MADLGRPSLYSRELEDDIVAWVSEGKTLREFCRQEGMPHFSTVYDWMDDRPDFFRRFTRAREIGADVIAQETQAIADDGQNDFMENIGPDGQSLGWKLNGEHVQRSKLRIETRLKLLAKWFPQKYGEKVIHAGDKENPIHTAVSLVDAFTSAVTGGTVGHPARPDLGQVADVREGIRPDDGGEGSEPD